MKSHTNIANLIKARRLYHPHKYSQKDLSALLGLKNTLTLEKIERAERHVPLKMMASLSATLNISEEEFIEAAMKDYAAFVDNYFEQQFELQPEQPALYI